MKEKIAITVDRKLLSHVDRMIDGSKVKSRSHAIELLLSKSVNGAPKRAVILAGGKGTRLRR